DDGNFYAIDPGSGAQKWKFAAKSRVPSTPAVSGGKVYFTGVRRKSLRARCCDRTTEVEFQAGGERRFAGKHQHGVEPANETMPDPFDCFLSSPAVWNGAVFLGVETETSIRSMPERER